MGINREHWERQVNHANGNGYRHSNGNGYRITTSAIYAADITGNGGNPINTRALFMFDADTSSLTGGADDNLIFNDTDTLIAKLSVPGTFNARASEWSLTEQWLKG